MWFKRIGLFLLTNILVVVTISIVTSVLGIGPYLDANGINLSSLVVFCFFGVWEVRSYLYYSPSLWRR